MRDGPAIPLAIRGRKSGQTDALARQTRRALQSACRSLGLGPRHEIGLMLCDNPTIRRLNSRWRGIDRPTDVLSFPMFELKPGAIPPDGALGDIVISLPAARRAAKELGADLRDHVAWLSIHGLLHLLGHDHRKSAPARRMRRAEIELLGKLGIDA